MATSGRGLVGDGVGSGKGIISCIGNSADIGYSIRGYDPIDSVEDPSASLISDFDIPKEMLIVNDTVEDDLIY